MRHLTLGLIVATLTMLCHPSSSILNIKMEAEKVIKVQQVLRQQCNQNIQNREPRKLFKAKLNTIMRLANAAYRNAENNEFCAQNFLQEAKKLLNKAEQDPLIKNVKAAL